MANPKAFKRVRYIEKSERDIVSLARLVLALVTSTSNILIAIEEIKKFFPRLRLIVVDDEILPHTEARAYPKQWIIKVRRGIHEGLRRGSTRGRWTLAHELGHVLLRHPGRSLARQRVAIEDDSTIAGRIEREADKFARSLLLPFDRYSDHSVDEIMKESGVGWKSAERRINEFADAKSTRASLERRGYDISKYTAEFGHRATIERRVPIIASAFDAVIRESHSAAPFGVIRGNLFATSVLIAAASALFQDAYSSLRRENPSEPTFAAAALALSIASIRPLRAAGAARYGEVRSINSKCAIKIGLMSLGRMDIGAAGVPTNLRDFHSGYFAGIASIGEELIRDASTMLTLECFPGYETYNADHDLCWTDIEELESLAGYFLMIHRSSVK